MTEKADKVSIAVSELNTHIVTVLLSRVASIVGIPAVGLLIYSMVTDIKTIETLVTQIDRRLLVVEMELNIDNGNVFRFQKMNENNTGTKDNEFGG